jgi:hypothetical protein
MKTLKEIETKIKDTTYDIDWAYSQQMVVPEEIDRRMGWLVGLGMAKAWLSTGQKEEIAMWIYLSVEVNPPYEQGEKEALEWCLE